MNQTGLNSPQGTLKDELVHYSLKSEQTWTGRGNSHSS